MEEELETYEMKKTYMNQLLGNIRDISDLNYQQKAWVENSMPNIRDSWEE